MNNEETIDIGAPYAKELIKYRSTKGKFGTRKLFLTDEQLDCFLNDGREAIKYLSVVRSFMNNINNAISCGHIDLDKQKTAQDAYAVLSCAIHNLQNYSRIINGEFDLFQPLEKN